jgi:AGCS family alanine or glycine:cation symporter
MKWLAVLFAVFTALASFGIGCTVQANSIALLANETFGVPTWVVGIFVCLLSALVILGGVRAIARVCTVLVPFMALLYVVGCIAILCINGSYVWPAVKLIVESAFNPSAAGGGLVGGTVIMAARYGIARGLFSNESGMGSAPIVAAAAKTRNPVQQALVSSTATFWDTVIICALTGLVLVSSILAYPEITYNDGAALTKMAFDKIPYVGAPLLTFGLLTFAFSTILGWSYYGESAVRYLENRGKAASGQAEPGNECKGKICGVRCFSGLYRILYIVALFFGSIVNLEVIWNVADCMNAFMTIPNLIALLLLSGVVARETKKYLWDDRLDDIDESL